MNHERLRSPEITIRLDNMAEKNSNQVIDKVYLHIIYLIIKITRILEIKFSLINMNQINMTIKMSPINMSLINTTTKMNQINMINMMQIRINLLNTTLKNMKCLPKNLRKNSLIPPNTGATLMKFLHNF